MVNSSLLPSPVLQFCDQNGHPYAGGTVESYEMGTFSPKATYLDIAGTIPNEQPVTLDAAGRGIFYGYGIYRLILRDIAGNLIWDGNTESYLGGSVISAVMLPVVGAATLAEARRLMGIDDAIQLALLNVSLMQGPTGPIGPTGPQGIQGVTGPTGTTPTGTGNLSENGFWLDPSTGFMITWGTDSTDFTGAKRVNYAKQFDNVFNAQATVANNAINLTCRVINPDTGGVTIGIEDTDNKGGYPAKFYYLAVGRGHA